MKTWFIFLLPMLAFATDGEKLKRAGNLPKQAQMLRDQGLAPAEVKAALKATREAKLGADEATDVLEASGKAVKENGKIDNFGGFVKTKVSEGLRGKELAAAIRAEHAERGMGKGNGKSKGKSKGKHGDKHADKDKGGQGKGGQGKGGGQGKDKADGKKPKGDKGAGKPQGENPNGGAKGGKRKGKGKKK